MGQYGPDIPPSGKSRDGVMEGHQSFATACDNWQKLNGLLQHSVAAPADPGNRGGRPNTCGTIPASWTGRPSA